VLPPELISLTFTYLPWHQIEEFKVCEFEEIRRIALIEKERVNQMLNGLMDGKEIMWYENGQRWWEHTWKEGQRHGKWIIWDINGQKRYEENWKEGKEHGKYTRWYADGQKLYEMEYIHKLDMKICLF